MQIGNQSVEQEITIHDDLSFVTKQDVASGETNVAAYTITGPDGYVLGLDAGLPLGLEFRDNSGAKLDGSTRVTIQKCDRQGNPLGDSILFSDQLSKFDYAKMRNDPDFFRKTTRSALCDEREIIKIFLDIPSGANGFSAADSRVTIGDSTSDFGKPVEIIDHDDLSTQETQAVKAASTRGGN